MRPPVNADLAGRTCIVTGANAGIGKEIAHNLAGMGAAVVLACRSEERGRAAREEIAAATGNPRVELMLVDISSQASVRAFAASFLARHPRLHVLVNNAAVWARAREMSADGIELTWATNVLGPFLLTNLLVDRLVESAPARVVNVTSRFAGVLDLDDLQFERRRFGGARAYAQSKQANRMLSWGLAERLAGTGVTVNAVHPGPVNTELFRLQRGVKGALMAAFFKTFGRSPGAGADTATWLAASPEVEGVTGQYWWSRRARRCRFRDPATIGALWAKCEEMAPGRE